VRGAGQQQVGQKPAEEVVLPSCWNRAFCGCTGIAEKAEKPERSVFNFTNGNLMQEIIKEREATSRGLDRWLK
jgi:hypothetical protein